MAKSDKQLHLAVEIDLNQANAHFADQVKFLRFKLKISQASLAKELGVSVPTVSRWERGEQTPHLMALGSFYEYSERCGIDFNKTENIKLK